MPESDPSRIFAPGLLAGRVCLVSGAGSGLGRATALELAALGATVIGCGRRAEPLEETGAAAAGLDGSFEHEAADIRDEEAVERLVDGVVERLGRLDVLVNNAAVFTRTPLSQQVRLTQLGRAHGEVINKGIQWRGAFLVFLVMFAVSCATVIWVNRVREGWRLAALSEPSLPS